MIDNKQTISHPLVVKGVRVEYESCVAVNDVSLLIESGMILGLLGPNGAGKTSLMKAIAGLIETTYGEIYICGASLEDERSKALSVLGFQPDIPPIYEDVSVYEFLELFASAYGVPRERRDSKIEGLLHKVKLFEKRDESVGNLSRGMKQRIFLAKTLISDPTLIILDEPASGLDPIARREFVELIRMLSKEGRAIILSSHILEELNTVCDALCVMSKGIVLDQGRLEEVRHRLNPPIEVEVKLLTNLQGAFSYLQRQFVDQKEYMSNLTLEDEHITFHLSSSGDSYGGVSVSQQRSAEILNALVQEGYTPHHFNVREANLQDIFLQLSGGEQ